MCVFPVKSSKEDGEDASEYSRQLFYRQINEVEELPSVEELYHENTIRLDGQCAQWVGTRLYDSSYVERWLARVGKAKIYKLASY